MGAIASSSRAVPVARTVPSGPFTVTEPSSSRRTSTSSPSYTGDTKRASIVEPVRNRSPQRSMHGWVMYAHTSTPGTNPPRNPKVRATASSCIRFVESVAVLYASMVLVTAPIRTP